jgi:dipeptidase E
VITRRRILALGGHDFDRRVGNDAICDLIIELADSPRPKICLLPTASGDPEDQIARFRRAFAERDCVPQAISLFRLGENPVDLRDELLNQDVIYAGGGSMVNLIAIWRAQARCAGSRAASPARREIPPSPAASGSCPGASASTI